MTRIRSETEKQCNRERVHRKRKEHKATIRFYKAEHPCIDCGETDITKLEFDHVRGNKRHKINYMTKAGYTWNTIIKEIAKCEVRCCSCHIKRHNPNS